MANVIKERSPFGIPERARIRHFSNDFLKLFGINENPDPKELGLALVMLEGRSYDGGVRWLIDTHSFTSNPLHYGSVGIESDNGEAISSGLALQAAEDWIRTNPKTENVPCSVYQSQTDDPNVACGLLLVRASEIQPGESQVFHTANGDITLQRVCVDGNETSIAAADSRWVKLGEKPDGTRSPAEMQYNALIRRMIAKADQAFLLTWRGGRIPRGVLIHGMEIGWTQHGIVTSTDGEEIGEYERLIDGGDDGETRKMLVFTQSPADSNT